MLLSLRFPGGISVFRSPSRPGAWTSSCRLVATAKAGAATMGPPPPPPPPPPPTCAALQTQRTRRSPRHQERYHGSFVVAGTGLGRGEAFRANCRGGATNGRPQLRQRQPPYRNLSFSYAGPRTLNEILKVELLESKTASEISDLWLLHHEPKVRLPERVVGMCLKGHEGSKVLERASRCRFYVQPIFRDDGFFMLLSQFQDPNHFLLAYLEDYKMDPSSATPLVTFAIFTDYAETKDLALVRADVLNASITDDEAYKVVSSVLSNYRVDEEYGSVQVFNQKSAEFDVDDYISRMNDRWNNQS